VRIWRQQPALELLGAIKSNLVEIPLPRKISQGRVVVLSEGLGPGRGLLKETTMSTRHFSRSAAIAAVLAVAVPVHAQILVGGAQGGLRDVRWPLCGARAAARPHVATSRSSTAAAAASLRVWARV